MKFKQLNIILKQLRSKFRATKNKFQGSFEAKSFMRWDFNGGCSVLLVLARVDSSWRVALWISAIKRSA